MLRPQLAAAKVARVAPPPKATEPFYRTAQWQRVREQAMRDGLGMCAECGRHGVRLFVDHVIELKDGGAPLDPANLQVLCGACHTSKTVRERRARKAGAGRISEISAR